MNITDKSNEMYLAHPILLNLLNELSFSNNSLRTIENYVCGVFRFLEFIKADDDHLENLDENDIHSYLVYLKDEKKLANTSVNSNNSYLRFFFQAILEKPINIYKIPMIKIHKKELSFLYPDQIKKLLKVSEENYVDSLIIRLGVCAGLRIDEVVVSLKVSDIDKESPASCSQWFREI